MTFLLFLLTLYIFVWPAYFRIALFSLEYYVYKNNISEQQLELFIKTLKFPFTLLNTDKPHGLTGDSTFTILRNLDQIKKDGNSFIFTRCFISIIPITYLLTSGAS
jgi:hypothetical protein